MYRFGYLLLAATLFLAACQSAPNAGPGPTGERVSNFVLQSNYLCLSRSTQLSYRFSYQGDLSFWRTYWQADDGLRYDTSSIIASVVRDEDGILVNATVPSFENLLARTSVASSPQNAQLVLEATFENGYRQTRTSYSIPIFDC